MIILMTSAVFHGAVGVFELILEKNNEDRCQIENDITFQQKMQWG